mmetsp:Transcript_5106/g.5829  ORF Transcript_5106/g.5829 Transcript_5106/m.5829 type:complete len:170 (+) Transcript_5106:30-539(+)
MKLYLNINSDEDLSFDLTDERISHPKVRDSGNLNKNMVNSPFKMCKLDNTDKNEVDAYFGSEESSNLTNSLQGDISNLLKKAISIRKSSQFNSSDLDSLSKNNSELSDSPLPTFKQSSQAASQFANTENLYKSTFKFSDQCFKDYHNRKTTYNKNVEDVSMKDIGHAFD